VTLGALDDLYRNALSKISHLHFASTPDAGARLAKMGEERWRIHVTGAPSLDRLNGAPVSKVDLPPGSLLVTYHPVTRQPGEEGPQTRALLQALKVLGRYCIFTAPNADPGRQTIDRLIRDFCRKEKNARYIESAGSTGYFSLMSSVSAMVGNSSSGILEAASFGLPVVNIGIRQQGRFMPRNVIACGYGSGEILRAIRKAVSPGFGRSLRGLRNPYGDGHSAERIVRVLESIPLNERLLRKEPVN
jgi:UDP-hydrolysing UDP-N-acetyl-D-glucosamine 2-epimerase